LSRAATVQAVEVGYIKNNLPPNDGRFYKFRTYALEPPKNQVHLSGIVFYAKEENFAVLL
jgi:hypothetical protein